MESAGRTWLYVGVITAIFVLVMLTFWMQEQYLLFSVLIIMLSMIPFFYRFERRKIEAEEIVLVAMLAAIAAVSRAAFVIAPPSIQPASFVIMMSGLVFGAETGFMVGSMAALVSNIFLGQGPWTPWQMFAWGMMGLTAGLFRKQVWMQSKLGMILFGFIWGFLFNWIMNIWHVLGFLQPSVEMFIAAYIASFYFDLAHALSNVFFLLAFATAWIRILERIQKKYGLLK